MNRLQNNFVQCRALFTRKGAVDYEELGVDINDDLEEDDFVFNISEISSYNPGTDHEVTTLRLRNGDSFRIACNFEKFNDFIINKI